MKHKRNDPTRDPWDSKGNEKMQFLFLLLVTSLQSWVAKNHVTVKPYK